MTTVTASHRSGKQSAPCFRRSAKRWHVEEHSAGWISFHRECRLKNNQHPLTYHADWAGPVKLVESEHGGKLSLRYDFHLDPALGHEGDPSIDPELAIANDALQAAFATQAETFEESSRIAGWIPPPIEDCKTWLRQCGYEPTADDDQNLRLSIRRRGATGQVKLIREEGRLRFVMPLGRWGDLANENRHAMQSLASLANARCRLVRIVWVAVDKIDACEACVDLSGLPYTADQCRRRDGFWRAIVSLSMTALDLAVAQLASELAVLGDDKDQELVKLFPY